MGGGDCNEVGNFMEHVKLNLRWQWNNFRLEKLCYNFTLNDVNYFGV